MPGNGRNGAGFLVPRNDGYLGADSPYRRNDKTEKKNPPQFYLKGIFILDTCCDWIPACAEMTEN